MHANLRQCFSGRKVVSWVDSDENLDLGSWEGSRG